MTTRNRDNLPHFQVKLYVEDARLIYNAIDFYEKNRPEGSERPEHMQEPLEHIEWMKRSMKTLMMEASYQANK